MLSYFYNNNENLEDKLNKIINEINDLKKINEELYNEQIINKK